MTTISLNFMPAFYNKHLGLTYGEAYYFDPAYRATVDCAEQRFLYEALGEHGVGSRTPQPATGIFIQPIDLILLTQGATLDCPEDATLQTRGAPWAGLSVGEIERLNPHQAARRPIVERVLEQYRAMLELYGERADIFGLKAGSMCIHTPYTTAHQLCGESLFMLMIEEPETARLVLEKVWAVISAVFARLLEELHAKPTHLHLGDCSASMLSPAIYRNVVLPINQKITQGFAAVGYHSCGSSSHLLKDFAELPRMSNIQLGPGTDLREAVRLMPTITMQPLIDPLLMRNGSRSEVAAQISTVLEATVEAPETMLCGWSFDRETPIENVAAMYETVAERNHE
ncbi:MAG: uroporphyrinogen decarboxylase family protein [Armatimonadota bacterium]